MLMPRITLASDGVVPPSPSNLELLCGAVSPLGVDGSVSPTVLRLGGRQESRLQDRKPMKSQPQQSQCYVLAHYKLITMFRRLSNYGAVEKNCDVINLGRLKRHVAVE